MTTTRKIIQIAIDPALELSSSVVYALCSDGTIWSRTDVPGREWSQMEGVPQPQEVTP